VGTGSLAGGSVGTAQLADLGVTSAKLADGSVTSAKIVDGQVQTNDLANLGVTNGKLADDAVTTAKILDGGVSAADLAAGAVTGAKIKDGSLTGADVAAPDSGSGVLVGNANITPGHHRRRQGQAVGARRRGPQEPQAAEGRDLEGRGAPPRLQEDRRRQARRPVREPVRQHARARRSRLRAATGPSEAIRRSSRGVGCRVSETVSETRHPRPDTRLYFRPLA
jgi:hypothetical protein